MRPDGLDRIPDGGATNWWSPAFSPRTNLYLCRGRDRHQDHRLVSDLTWNIFRSRLILEYEVPKYDGDLGVSNLFVPLSAAVARAKIRHLRSAFGSQGSKRWFTADTFHGLLRLRGVESGAAEGLAEAFYARKALVSFGVTRTRDR